MSLFNCNICYKQFQLKHNLVRHVRTFHPSSVRNTTGADGHNARSNPLQFESEIILQEQFIIDNDVNSSHNTSNNYENSNTTVASHHAEENQQNIDAVVGDMSNTSSDDNDTHLPHSSYHDDDNSQPLHKSQLHLSIIELYALIKKHHIPPALFDDILEWYDNAQSLGFNKGKNGTSYEVTKNKLSSEFGSKTCGSPIEVNIDCSSLQGIPNISLYKFDFKSIMNKMYTDPKLMDNSLWGYRPTTDSNNNRVRSELNTADYWIEAEEHICRLNGWDSFPENHYLSPIVGFDDATILDNVGRLDAQPFLISLGNINMKNRKQSNAWGVLGFVPPYPKTGEEKAAENNKKQTKCQSEVFYHLCLKHLLEDMKACIDDKDGHKFKVVGMGEVVIHFDLAYIIGDSKGHDGMCAHKAGYSKPMPRMCRVCDIDGKVCDNPHISTTRVKINDIREVLRECITCNDDERNAQKEALKKCHELSQHPIWPVYFDYDFGGCEGGIFSSTPFEILHVYYLGVMKTLLSSIFNYCVVPESISNWFDDRVKMGSQLDPSNLDQKPRLPPGTQRNSVLFNKGKFEKMFRFIVARYKRQSDRDMPRAPFKKGVTSLGRLNGQEYPGLCLLTMICYHKVLKVPTKNEKDQKINTVTEKNYWCEKLEKQEKTFVKLLWQSLSLKCLLTQVEMTDDNVNEIEEKIIKYLQTFWEVIGEQREYASESGLRILKPHGLTHFAFQFNRLGCGDNFSGVSLESALKEKVKCYVKRTQRSQKNITRDLANRIYEHDLAIEAEKYAQKIRWLNKLTTNSNENEETTRNENHADHFTMYDNARVGKEDFSIELVDSEPKLILNRKRKENCFHPLSQHHTEANDWVETAVNHMKEIEATSARFFYRLDLVDTKEEMHSLIRCHPYFYAMRKEEEEGEWFDWIIVRWLLQEQGSSSYFHRAARVFLVFETEKRGGEKELFLVIRSIVDPANGIESRHPRMKWLQSDKLEEIYRIIPSEAISSTACVLPCENWKDENDNEIPSKKEDEKYYVIIPPQNTWKNIGWED